MRTWRLAKNIEKIKEKDKPLFFTHRCEELSAASTTKLESLWVGVSDRPLAVVSFEKYDLGVERAALELRGRSVGALLRDDQFFSRVAHIRPKF